MGDKEAIDSLDETKRDVAEHNVRLALVEQSIITIKDGMVEMKRDMSNFLEELRKNYVTRAEHEALVKRVDTMETRIWGLLVSVVLLFAGWIFALARR